MSPKLQNLSPTFIASRLWVISFAFLLALLPVSSYFNSSQSHPDSGLVAQLETQTLLHDNGLRLGLKTEQSGQLSPDIDPPDWQALVPTWLSSHCLHASQCSLAQLSAVEVTASRFLRPYLRAPPQS